MSNLSIKEMEALLLSPDQNQILSKMTPKSQNVEYLRLLQSLKDNQLDWPQLEARMKDFESNNKFDFQLKEKVNILRLIKAMDYADNDTARQVALDGINEKWFHLSFNYAKPAILETGELGVEVCSENEEERVKEDEKINKAQKLLDEFEQKPSLEGFQKLNARECLLSFDFVKLGDPNDMDRVFLEAIIRSLSMLKWRVSTLTNIQLFMEKFMRMSTEKMGNLFYDLEILFDFLPLSWLENYLKIENWANSEILFQKIIKKKINENMEVIERLGLEALREIKELFSGPVPNLCKNVLVSINHLILQRLILKDEYSKELFIEYLKQIPPSIIAYDSTRYDELTRNKAKKKCDNRHKTDLFFSHHEHGQIVDLCLRHFLKESDDASEWECFFGKHYLQKLFIEVKLLTGRRPEGFEHVFSESEIKTLSEKKEFKILRSNKKNFAKDEKVSLKVDLKNIEEVRIKVFQINVEQALLEDINVDFSKMDLLGLVAKEEYVFKYDKNPLEQWTEEYEFQNIQRQRRGVFIIDFLAGNMSSRGIITKGRLTLLSEKKKLGTMCVILDENRNICTGPKTGLYIHQKFHPVDNDGVIYLPNNDTSLTGEVIVCHDDYASVSNVEVTSPDLQFDFDVVFNREQVRTGNEVELILFPTLMLYNEPLNLSHFTKASVNVSFVSEEKITKTIEFNEENNNKVELKKGSFSVINVTVPPKTISMNIFISGEVLLHGKDTRKLSNKRRFNFVGPSSKRISQVYLNHDQEKGYVVKMKGRNGESIPNQPFRLGLTHPNMNTTHSTIEMKTGSNGERVIGRVSNVSNLEVWVDNKNDVRRTTPGDSTFFYTKRIFLAEGDGISLPIQSRENSFVLKGNCTKNIDELKDNIVENITNDENHVSFRNEMMTLTNLQEGVYHVAVGPSEDEELEIQVIQGERFTLQNRHFIQFKNRIIQLPGQNNFWRLREDAKKGVQITQGSILRKGGTREKPQTVEAVVFCHSFIWENSANLVSMNNNNRPRFKKQYKLSKNNNKYFNNKRINEEILYVLRRRGMQEFMGNTLEKPTLLLKRQKVKDTLQENEVLGAEKEFKRCMDKYMDSSLHGLHDENFKILKLEEKMDLSTDFLSKPGRVITQGLSLDEDNYLQIPEEQIKDFNHVYAVFNLGGQVILTKTIKTQSQEPEKQSLVLSESKKEGYVYRDIRRTNTALKDSSHKIENADKTEYRLIKSLSDLSVVMDGLNPNMWKRVKEWQFLWTWSKLTPVEKLKKYDEFISHEMNVFLRFKDPQFFEEVVTPHIQNKREKTVVDLYLLKDRVRLEKYLDFGSFQRLSLLEKVLVIMGLSQDKRAKNLANRLEMEMNLPRNRKSEEDFKRVFDKIIESTDKDEDVPAFTNLQKNVPENERSRCLETNRVSLSRNAWGNNIVSTSSKKRKGRVKRMELRRKQECEMKIVKEEQEKKLMEIEKMVKERKIMELKSMIEEEKRKCEEEQKNYKKKKLYKKSNKKAKFSSDSDSENSSCDDSETDFEYESSKFRNAGAEVYKGLESTTEYQEKKFFFTQNQLTFNSFYSDLLSHVITNNGSPQNFLNPNFIYCVNSPTEMVFIFALLDLSFENIKPLQTLDQFTLTITPKNNCLIFSKQISELKADTMDLDFLISQRFYDPKDRYHFLDDGTKVEKPVREFKSGKVYGSRVVVTNSTVSTQKVSVITEIPQGALPVNRADTLKAMTKIIESFRSEIIEFQFYFPHNGKFTIYPSTVAKGDKILATSKSGVVFEVGKKVKNTVMESISDILSGGKIEDVLEFLRTKNILNNEIFQFESIGWLLKNEKVWRDVINVYRQRGIYDYDLWSFGFKYRDMDTIKEFINNELVPPYFQYMESSLVNIDTWQTKDYFPLVNPRAHSVSNQSSNILNKQFKLTYEKLLNYLIEKRFFTELTIDDKILWITYLLLQDRIEEANQMFWSISKSMETTNPVTIIQKDYLEAYLDFMTGYPSFAKSKEICQKYLSYPVLTWRNLFVEIANQLAEYENEDFEGDVDESQKIKTRVQQADESPFVKAEIVEDRVKVSFKNQSLMHLEYYQIDLEVLFSQDPYEEKLNSSLTKVLPFLTETHKVTNSSNFQSQTIKIPENLQTQNLLIRVVDESRQSTMLKYVPFKLNSSLNQKYGILKLTDPQSGKPMPKVYVKCFCRNSMGRVKFYKDGYTDLRGSFDFAAVSSNNSDTAESFKILVTSKEFGSKIFSAKPPVSNVKKVGVAKKIKSSNWRSRNKPLASKNMYSQVASKF